MPESPQNKGLFRPPVPFQSGAENGGAPSAAGTSAPSNNEAQGGYASVPQAGGVSANGHYAPGSQGPQPGPSRPTALSDYVPASGSAGPNTPVNSSNAAWNQAPASYPAQPGASPHSSNAGWNQQAGPMQYAPPAQGTNNGWQQMRAYAEASQGQGPQNWQQNGYANSVNNGQQNGWSQSPQSPQPPVQQGMPNVPAGPTGWQQNGAYVNNGHQQQNSWGQPPQVPASPAPPQTPSSAQNWNQHEAPGGSGQNWNRQGVPGGSGQNNSWGQPQPQPQPPAWQYGGPDNASGSNYAPHGWQQNGAYPQGVPPPAPPNTAPPAQPVSNGWSQQGAYAGAVPNSPNGLHSSNGAWGMSGAPGGVAQGYAGGPAASWNQAAAHAARKRSLRQKYADLPTPKKIMLLVLVVALLLPSIFIVVESIEGLILYNQARSGLQHFQNVQALFSGGPKGNTAKYLDVNKLRQAQVEVDAANSDFHSLSARLDHDVSIGLLNSMLPRQIHTARSLAHIGADATEIAQQGVRSAITLSPTLTPALSHPLGDGKSTQPIITPPVLNELGTLIDFALPRIHDMQQYSHDLDLTSLPLSDSQRKLIVSILPVLPVGEGLLTQIRGNMDVLGWLLGVDQPRTFLVETMDRGELRATGGFTGQFGELELNGGRMAPLNLKNIGQFEEDNRALGSPLDPVFAKVQGQAAPAPFTWWPIPNFGMRDANVSADFPTSAKLIMKQYQYEFGKQTEGLILFSPFLISHVLQVTGPVSVPEYKETITAENLETRLHYYQLDNVGIRQEELVEHVEDPQIARKLFTKRLSGLLLAKVQALPSDKLVNLGKEMLYAMKTRDLQVYFANEKLQKLIGQYGSTAEIDRSTTHDGLYVVQSNLSVSKASQYVTTSISDTVTLDAKGGATHMMKMRLVYDQKGPVYGLDTYRDYVRVYTPPNSQFISGTGFSHFGDPYCGGYYRACPQREDLFGTGEMICPIGTQIGLIPALNDDPYGDLRRPIDKIGAPLNMTSDEPGRKMFASWVVVPKNCTMNISLSWYVPPTGQQPYNLLIQRQSSTLPNLDITIVPPNGSCNSTKPGDLHYSHVQDGEDLSFTLANQAGGGCSLQVKPHP